MALERKALVVTATPGEDAPSVDALTDLLNDDWRLVSTTAMGGAGGDGPAQFAALVVVEREEKKAPAGFSAG